MRRKGSEITIDGCKEMAVRNLLTPAQGLVMRYMLGEMETVVPLERFPQL